MEQYLALSLKAEREVWRKEGPTDDERIMAIEGMRSCEWCSDQGWIVGEMGITRCACGQAGNSPVHSGLRPEQNIGSPAQSPIDHGYRPDCECSGCQATARICAELAGNSPMWIGVDWAKGCEPGSSPVIPDGKSVTASTGIPVIPDGYVMVPKEPTPEILATITEAIRAMRGSAATYARVLAAAPQPQNAQQNIPEIIPGWIPVSERMPERGDYLVTDGSDFDVQMFNGEWFIPGFVWEDKITHWMPLPAAPQEVKP